MINVAVMGYGVVGSGVAEILTGKKSKIAKDKGIEISLKKILDIRDFPDSLYVNLFTKQFDDILNDDTISIVAETIGGTGIAYKFTKALLESGKSVVTSNKAMVAAHGPEMLKIAKEHGVQYLFEASVGGGIPVIRTLQDSYACEEIHEMCGILNGTTNYMLTKMRYEKAEYNKVLAEAQKCGYAEADPTDDVEGYDACRKLAILSSIAWNTFVDYKDIAVQGIASLTAQDIELAACAGKVIKLIGRCAYDGKKLFATVAPMMIDKLNPLSEVNDAYNAILLKSDNLDNIMLYGRGAGKMPTASAVVSDIVALAENAAPAYYNWNKDNKIEVSAADEFRSGYFICLHCSNTEAAKAKIGNMTDIKAEFIDVGAMEDGAHLIAFCVSKITALDMRIKLERIKGITEVEQVVSMMMTME